jgi:hypothetical protein
MDVQEDLQVLNFCPKTLTSSAELDMNEKYINDKNCKQSVGSLKLTFFLHFLCLHDSTKSKDQKFTP